MQLAAKKASTLQIKAVRMGATALRPVVARVGARCWQGCRQRGADERGDNHEQHVKPAQQGHNNEYPGSGGSGSPGNGNGRRLGSRRSWR